VFQFGIEISILVFIPLTIKHNLSLAQLPKTKAKKYIYKDYIKDTHYLSLVDSLLFVTQTRPDIQFTIGLVVQFSNNPEIGHLEAAKCILQYLKGTAYKLVLGRHRKRSFNLIK